MVSSEFPKGREASLFPSVLALPFELSQVNNSTPPCAPLLHVPQSHNQIQGLCFSTSLGANHYHILNSRLLILQLPETAIGIEDEGPFNTSNCVHKLDPYPGIKSRHTLVVDFFYVVTQMYYIFKNSHIKSSSVFFFLTLSCLKL